MALCIALIYLVYYKSRIWYEVNDDQTICDVLSGVVAGKPDYHIIYQSVLLTKPLSFLYGVWNTIPWHGIVLLVAQFISIFAPLHAMANYCKRVSMYCVLTIAWMCLFVSTWYLRGNIQYTSTSMMLGFSGFIVLCFENQEKATKTYFYFGIIELLSYYIRPKAMELVLPIGFAVLFAVEIIKKQSSKIAYCVKKNLPYLLIIGTILLVGFGIQEYAFSSDEWIRAKEFENARTEMFDYIRIPEYSEFGSNSSEEKIYSAFSRYMILNYSEMSDVVVRASKSVEHEKERKNILEILEYVFWTSYYDVFGHVNQLVLCLWGILLCVSGMFKRLYETLAFVFLYFGAKLVSWGYIFYYGRMPYRITIPLYCIEAISLVVIIINIIYSRQEINGIHRKVNNILFAICFVGFVALTFRTGREFYGVMEKNKNGNFCLKNMEQEIIEYCNSNDDCRYVISNYIYSNYKREVLDVAPSKHNYIYSGGWFSASPYVENYNNSYLSNGRIFLITTEEPINNNVELELEYLKHRYNYEPQAFDEIELSTGAKAQVFLVSENGKAWN